jgi:signal transduction histidine kinase
VLWEGADRRAIWVPMFRTSDGRTLWVGRPVDDQPLREFRTEIVIRVLLIVLVLIIFQFIVARWITRRGGRFGRDLTEGVQRTLESDQPVVFAWDGPPEVRQLAADLTRLSQTHASHTRNLRAHARELEATNRYKSQFLANVSHELRTPLNSILLLSKLLASKGERLDEESLRQADVIHKAGRDLQALIDNILDLSRIEAGRLELHVEDADVGELLDDLHTLMAPQFDAKGLAFRIEKDADAPKGLRTDVDKVRQVLKNFLANAVKFTAQGQVTLRASAAPTPFALALSVHDTGIGIPLGKQGVVFEAFQQADGSTSRRYGGTGLGLAISRQLAGLIGGEIRLVSDAGEGAEFTLLLPAETRTDAGSPAVAPAPSLSEPDEAAVPVSEHLVGRQVLLMEPDVHQQLALSSMLRGLGMHLHLADDLVEALETLEEVERLDLVLIDAVMPGEGACATIQKLRETLGDDLVVVGLVTGQSPEAAETCVAEGADDFVLLPCSVTALSEVLLRHLGELVEHQGP